MTVKYPHLYITYFKNCTRHTLGPFHTLAPDGCGDVIGQDWICYRAQRDYGDVQRITVPKSHLIECR